MLRYILRRLLQSIPTLLGISLIGFILIHAAPGGPFNFFDPNLTPAAKEMLIEQQGLDQPVALQYVKWMTGFMLRESDVSDKGIYEKYDCQYRAGFDLTICNTSGGLLRGDLGTSIQTRQPVWDRLVERMPATARLSLASLFLTLLIGIPLGIFSAIYRGSIFDNLVRFFSVVGQTVPDFFMGLMLIFIFAVFLRLLPTGGESTPCLINCKFDIVDRLRHIIMPAFVLALGGIAFISRVMRTETLEVISQDYIRTAKAKGLNNNKVWFTHALRNSLIPLMTILGPAIVGIIGGAVIIENVFSWPGMGRLTLSAALQRDYPMVLGAMIFFSFLTIIGNLLSDILYGMVDPRVRLS